MIIETARLRLRPFASKDAPSVLSMLNDWEVAQWLSVPPYPYGAADFEHYFEIVRQAHEAPHAMRFAVAELHSDELIGSLAVDMQANGDGELGYWYGRPHWGRGYATEAAKTLIAHALASPAIRRLTAITDPANEASHRVLLKSGFRFTGLRQRDPPSRRGAASARHYELGSRSGGTN